MTRVRRPRRHDDHDDRRSRSSPTANGAPTLEIAADPAQGTGPLAVQLQLPGERPGRPDPLDYVWAFGDGGFSAEPNPVHTYLAAGIYTATLTVTEDGARRPRRPRQIDGHGRAGRPAPAPKAPDAAPAPPAQAPWFGVSEPVKTSVSGFAKSGLAVKVTATQAMSGSAKMTVSKKVAKQLSLKKTTLATGKVCFTGAGSKSVTFTALRVRQAGADEGQGLREGHALREPAPEGESAKNSTRAGHAQQPLRRSSGAATTVAAPGSGLRPRAGAGRSRGSAGA